MKHAATLQSSSSGSTAAGSTAQLSILVAIANHGTKNDRFAARLIDEYRCMRHRVEIVVLSNIPKPWPGIEVRIGAPTSDPWSLPFAHKRLFAERIEEFDLFIYTEDDTLLTEAHIDAFLEATEVLPSEYVAGFLREERDGGGRRYISSAHSHFHWDPGTVQRRGDKLFASFTNDHSACYVLTRAQLQLALDSGGFLVDPHDERYDLLVTAATDPYTQCGLRRLVCVSELDRFVMPHLPSAYIGRMGLEREAFETQAVALAEIERGERSAGALTTTTTRAWRERWSKSFYEPVEPEVVEAVPRGARRVLSIGCGWGALEAALVERGHQVTAAALDEVIGACARERGLEVIGGSREAVLQSLHGRRFEVIVISNLLHLTEKPAELLADLAPLLEPSGRWILRTPNFGYAPTAIRRLARRRGYRGLSPFERSGLHPTTAGRVRRWLRSVGANVECVRSVVAPRFASLARASVGQLDRLLSRDLVLVAIGPSTCEGA